MSNGSTAMVPTGATSREDGFGRTEMVRHTETQAQAVASMVRAQVEARYAMAVHRPRSWSDVRHRLLQECKRERFCESAIYVLPRGGQKIQGPSIRFAEAALRCMTNVLPETRVLVDDDTKRIVQVSVTDLESNITYTHEVVIAKLVERKQARDRELVVSERTNSLGQRIFIVAASDDELTMKQNATVSKALRTLALRMLPGDILDDALDEIAKTFKQGGKDPAAERKKIEDSFAELGVRPSQLADYLGMPLEQASPAQTRELRALYTAIRDGQTNFATALAEVREGRGDGSQAPAGDPAKPSQAERLKEQAKTKAKPKEAPAAAPAPAPAAAPAVAPKAVDPLDCTGRKDGDTFEAHGRRYVVRSTAMGLVPVEQVDARPVVATQDAPPDDRGDDPERY